MRAIAADVGFERAGEQGEQRCLAGAGSSLLANGF
jgi:hypothetical protein